MSQKTSVPQNRDRESNKKKAEEREQNNRKNLFLVQKIVKKSIDYRMAGESEIYYTIKELQTYQGHYIKNQRIMKNINRKK